MFKENKMRMWGAFNNVQSKFLFVFCFLSEDSPLSQAFVGVRGYGGKGLMSSMSKSLSPTSSCSELVMR